MKSPSTIKFSDIEIKPLPVNSPGEAPYMSLIPKSWTRIQFDIPSNTHYVGKIYDWIRTNSGDCWSGYYYSPGDKETFTVVIKFKDRNDALMFKLRDGFQAWKTEEY